MHLLTTSEDINCDKIMMIRTFVIKRPDTTSLLELEQIDHLLTYSLILYLNPKTKQER